MARSKQKKWLSFEEARDLMAARGKISKTAAAESLAKGIESGKVPFRVPPAQITVKGIDVLMPGGWMTMNDTIGCIMEERKLSEDEAKKWMCNELADRRLRWRAKEVVINGRTLDRQETERWLQKEGGEYVPWQN